MSHGLDICHQRRVTMGAWPTFPFEYVPMERKKEKKMAGQLMNSIALCFTSGMIHTPGRPQQTFRLYAGFRTWETRRHVLCAAIRWRGLPGASSFVNGEVWEKATAERNCGASDGQRSRLDRTQFSERPPAAVVFRHRAGAVTSSPLGARASWEATRWIRRVIRVYPGKGRDETQVSFHGVSEDFDPKHREPRWPHRHEEEDVPSVEVEVQLERPAIKEEDEEEFLHVVGVEEPENASIQEEKRDALNMLPLTFFPLESEEDEDQVGGAESGGAEPPRSSSSQRVTEEGDGGSQSDGFLAPLSYSHDPTSHSCDTDDEQPEGDVTCDSHDTRMKCSLCGQTFRQKGNLKTHVRRHTGEKPFTCSVCGKIFASKRDLNTHTRTHTGEKPYPCSVCHQRFSQRGNLRKHARTHTGEKPFACSVCEKSFALKKNLTAHMRTHTGERPFACLLCEKRFTLKKNLTTHMKRHIGEKAFACSVCEKRFTLKTELTRHTRTHTGEKPFACSVCNERFTVKTNLATHTKTHCGEKPFACSVCRQRFPLKGDFIAHTVIHSEEKPFACPVCGQRFALKANLTAHQRTHTGEKPFACPVCDQRFSMKANLKRHTRTHTGEKPFSCSVCHKRFSSKHHVKRHKCIADKS